MSHWEETPVEDPGHVGESLSNVSWRKWPGTGTSRFLCSSCCPSDPIAGEVVDDGWMEIIDEQWTKEEKDHLACYRHSGQSLHL